MDTPQSNGQSKPPVPPEQKSTQEGVPTGEKIPQKEGSMQQPSRASTAPKGAVSQSTPVPPSIPQQAPSPPAPSQPVPAPTPEEQPTAPVPKLQPSPETVHKEAVKEDAVSAGNDHVISPIRTFHDDAAYAQGKERLKHVINTKAPDPVEEKAQAQPQQNGEEIPYDPNIIPSDKIRSPEALRENRTADEMRSGQYDYKVKKEEEKMDVGVPNKPEPPRTALKKQPTKPIVRTYEDDSSEALKKKKASVISIAVAEQENKAEQRAEEEVRRSETRRRRMLLMSAFFFLLAGAGVAAGVWYFNREPAPPSPITTDNPSAIYSESRTVIRTHTLTPDEIIARTKEAFATEVLDGKVHEIIFTTEDIDDQERLVERRMSAAEVLSILTPRAQASFRRALGEVVSVGVIGVGTSSQPFIVADVEQYENAYAGLLRYEPFMHNDLKAFIPSITYTTPESTATSSSDISVTDFYDRTIDNTDLRILYGQDAQVRLLYTLPRQESLIITTSLPAYEALDERVERRLFER